MRIPRSSSSRSIFIDTSAFYAITAGNDSDHPAATRLMRRIGEERRRLVTTNFIIAETHALLLTRLRRYFDPGEARRVALRTIVGIHQSVITVERLTPSDETRALEILEQYGDKDLSFTDATSFAVMERLRISSAFTFDSDFAQAGFTVLR